MESSKAKRCFTIMIVPHTEESTFSLRIPLFVVQVVVVFLVLSLVGVSVLGYAYLKAAAEANEANMLRQINRAQQEEINALAIETEKMMEQIQTIDELVDLVTDKLDLDPEDLNNSVQNQAFEGPNSYVANSAAEVYEFDRSYGSRALTTNGVLGRAAENIILLQNIVPEKSESLDTVGEFVIQADAKPSIWPCRGRLISGFGMRRIPYSSGYQFHTGVDIIGAHGSEIWATAGGEVIFTGYRGSYGNMVIIDHGYEYETYYAHLTGFAVRAGDFVERGQIIGYMGASGRVTGTHLHYEVHYGGSPVNPNNYMKKQ
ncbi:MAG: M23 family metallopeptidase [Bacillota bacterium]|nr:M23 family metallopeptidase [Bacillota bacterium]MDW7729032.1 M23 family metallopeptidase [Bacillota bacterium]